jgi:hypothetical protein
MVMARAIMATARAMATDTMVRVTTPQRITAPGLTPITAADRIITGTAIGAITTGNRKKPGASPPGSSFGNDSRRHGRALIPAMTSSSLALQRRGMTS